MGELNAAGFRWDTGPSVITMREVFEDLFAAVGRNMEDYFFLQPVEPLTRYFYPDGTVLDASRDLSRMSAEIQKISPDDAAGYQAFLAYAARLNRIVSPVFIHDEPPGLASFRKVSPLDAFRIDGLRTMNRAIGSFVRAPHLKQLLGRFATYVGASPFQAPATLNVIADVELSQGVWYPEGGIYRIAEGLARLAGELGVEIRTGTTVDFIQLERGRVQAVFLVDGSRIPANAVIANVDVSTVNSHLLRNYSRAEKIGRKLAAQEPSCSGFILFLGVNKTHQTLAHHNIFFSNNYRQEFRDIFERGAPPQEPTVYAAITAKSTPEDAPAGQENWFVLVNAPALGAQWDWAETKFAYRERVLQVLAKYGYDLRPFIVHETIWTPEDLERHTGARRGALYGASSNNRWAAFRRPHNRSSEVQGLYFAGGTTHPGGGVPMVMLSGKVASDLLLQDSPVHRQRELQ